MSYTWRTGYPAKVSADVAGEVLAKLHDEGRLTAKDLVLESKPEDALLHKCFTWDDKLAAEKYRISEAQGIIGAIQIERHDAPPVKKYFSVTRTTETYHSIEVLMSSAESRNLLLESARKEYHTFKMKYETLMELAKFFEFGDSVLG